MEFAVAIATRTPVRTVSVLAEPSLKDIVQAADRLYAWALIRGAFVVERAVVTDFGPLTCRVHLPIADGVEPHPETGIELDTLPGGAHARVADVRFEDIRAVGDVLLKNLASAAGFDRAEFHSVNGDFFTGDLTLPLAKAPQHAPAVLRLPEADETTRLVESEPIRAVTIARQHGTGGELVAQSVARKLGLRLVDHEVLREAADATGVSPEAIDVAAQHGGVFDRMLRGLALGGGAVPSMWMPPLVLRASPLFTSPIYRDFVEEAIRHLAERGNVLILGHGAQLVLKDRSAVFRVLIAGGIEYRATQAMVQGHSWKEAVRLIREADDERVAYFKQFYGAGWLDPSTYDLVVNTDRMAVDSAAVLISTAVRMRARPLPAGVA